MSKKSILTILAILIIPMLAFWGLTFTRQESSIASASSKPQILKFSSTMCLECKQVEKIFKELLPKYQDKVGYTSIVVDNKNDMNNHLIKKYHVQLVPTVVMLNSDGTEVQRFEGAASKDEYESCIKGLK